MTIRLALGLSLAAALAGCSRAASQDFELSFESEGSAEGIWVLYRFTLHGDGRVEYFGKRGVKLLGKQEGRIDPSKARELLAGTERLHFLDLKGDYSPKGWSDLYCFELSLRDGERRNSVGLASFHPPEEDWKPRTPEEEIGAQLDAFSMELERAVNVQQWIGTPEEVFANHFWVQRDRDLQR
jgi:hypothetical protein